MSFPGAKYRNDHYGQSQSQWQAPPQQWGPPSGPPPPNQWGNSNGYGPPPGPPQDYGYQQGSMGYPQYGPPSSAPPHSFGQPQNFSGPPQYQNMPVHYQPPQGPQQQQQDQGGQARDTDGDEDDGYDEVIYPVDHQRAGHIVDDIIHDILVKPLPAGCRLTAIFDSCHSASALDLPYIYSTQGKIKEPNLLADAGQGALKAATSYMRGDLGGALGALGSFAKQAMSGNKAEQISKQTKTSAADVISWSGCKDDQTSADTSEAGKATGAMSYAFISALSQYPQQSYIQLLNSIRDILQGKYSQRPQLSASHPMDMNLLFIM